MSHYTNTFLFTHTLMQIETHTFLYTNIHKLITSSVMGINKLPAGVVLSVKGGMHIDDD